MTNFLSKKVETQIINKLFESCYQPAETVPEILNRFSESLKHDSNIPEDISILLDIAISKYRDIITNPVYLSDFRKIFNEVHDVLVTDNTLSSFKMEGRCKSALGSVEKMITLLKEGRSLDRFRDALGIRIVLFGRKENEIESQKKLYQVTNTIIKFLIEKGFILCDSDNLPKMEILKDGIKIVVPEKSEIPSIYKSCVKDFVFNPTSKGYQSIHMVFRAPNGACIEIQLRTEPMHLHAEYFDANHVSYKLTKYTDGINEKRITEKIDFSKIDLPGFRYLGLDDKKYADYVGLVDSLRIYFRTYIPWQGNTDTD